jgi:hypothetical protein
MQNKPFRFGPLALTATLTTNILNPPTLTGGTAVGDAGTNTKIILTHIRVVNKTAGAVTCSLWIGATGANAAGTEFAFQGTSVPANSYVDWYGRMGLIPTDFLVGGASALTSLSIQGEGEIGIA